MLFKRTIRIIVWALSGFVLANIIGFIILYKDDIPVDELKQKYANEHSRFIQIDSIEVHYRDEGNLSDSIPLILLHGMSSSLLTWDSCVAKLKGEHRLIRLDLPAFGLTGPNPRHDYSIDYYITFLHRFLQSLQVKRCVLIGNSLGGFIAWQYAAEYPEEADGLILIDASGYPLENVDEPIGFKLGKMPPAKFLMRSINPRSIVKTSLLEIYGDDSKVTEQLVDQYCDLILREGNREALYERLNTKIDFDTALISTVQTKTMLIWGDRDNLIPMRYAYKFQRDLKHDTLVVLSGAGHTPMEEVPGSVAMLIHDFVKSGR